MSALEQRYQRELTKWRPSQDTTGSQAQGCQLTLQRLACFTVFRECNNQTDIEWPLCLELCQAYERNCGEAPARLCEEPLFRDASDSKLCSGSADPQDHLTWRERVGIIFGSIVAVLLVLLVLLLWLFRCWPCRSRPEPPPQPPQLGLGTDGSVMETPTDAAFHSSDNVLLPVRSSRDDFARMCTLFRRPRRRAQISSGSSSNPIAPRLSAAVRSPLRSQSCCVSLCVKFAHLHGAACGPNAPHHAGIRTGRPRANATLHKPGCKLL